MWGVETLPVSVLSGMDCNKFGGGWMQGSVCLIINKLFVYSGFFFLPGMKKIKQLYVFAWCAMPFSEGCTVPWKRCHSPFEEDKISVEQVGKKVQDYKNTCKMPRKQPCLSSCCRNWGLSSKLQIILKIKANTLWAQLAIEKLIAVHTLKKKRACFTSLGS